MSMSREKNENAEKIPRLIDIGNKALDTDVEYIDAQLVADYYEVTLETVMSWINQGQLSGKPVEGQDEEYLVPKEEFEYLKSKREKNMLDEAMQEFLGEGFGDDWEVEIKDYWINKEDVNTTE